MRAWRGVTWCGVALRCVALHSMAWRCLHARASVRRDAATETLLRKTCNASTKIRQNLLLLNLKCGGGVTLVFVGYSPPSCRRLVWSQSGVADLNEWLTPGSFDRSWVFRSHLPGSETMPTLWSRDGSVRGAKIQCQMIPPVFTYCFCFFNEIYLHLFLYLSIYLSTYIYIYTHLYDSIPPPFLPSFFPGPSHTFYNL